jgi:thiaminase
MQKLNMQRIIFSFSLSGCSFYNNHFYKNYSTNLFKYYDNVISKDHAEIRSAWVKTNYKFNDTIKTRLVKGIEMDNLEEKEFNAFLLPDLIYLKNLALFLKNRSNSEANQDIKNILEARSNMFMKSYNNYAFKCKNIEHKSINNDYLIRNHFKYLGSLSNNELIIAMLPCMANFRAIGIYLNNRVPQTSQWRWFVERRIRPELLEVLNEFSKQANEQIAQKIVSPKNALEILEKNIDFDNNFINESMSNKTLIQEISKNVPRGTF